MTSEELQNINPRVLRLIKALGTETLTRRGICGNMELKCRRSLWDNYVMPSRDAGYVVMAYPAHPNSPDQAYRLTQKGLDMLAEIEAHEFESKKD